MAVSDAYVKDLEERNKWQQGEILRLTALLPPHTFDVAKPEVAALGSRDISNEEWRQYRIVLYPLQFDEHGSTRGIVYRIANPLRLYVGKTTHRIVDADGVVHLVPAPGYFGCVVEYQPRPGAGDAQRF